MNRKLRLFVFLQSIVFATMFLFGGPAGYAQLSSGTNVNLSKMSGDQSECAIAINPTNKLQLFVLCNNNAGPGLFAARSIDRGLTWTYPDPSKTIANGANPALGPAACCDPTLSWDSFGNLFIAYIDSNLTSIVVLLSTDGGQTFTHPASFGPFTSPDQPTIVAADTTAAGAPVAVWIVWHQNAPSGPIVASGAAVTGLGAVGAFSALQNVPGTNDCSYGDVAIAENGAVVQVCQTPSTGDSPAPTTKLLVNTKPDGLGPNPFGAAVQATTTNVGAFHSIPAQSSRTIDAEAGLAYDRNPASPHHGRLYLVYTEEPAFGSGSTQILLRFSDNDGGIWSAPIRVDDDTTSGRSKFFPKIATNTLSGNIAICWYDTRNSATNTAMQVFCTISNRNLFPAFIGSNLQVSAGASTSSSSPNQFGDYSALAYFLGFVHPAWPDTSNSTGDNPDGTTRFDIYSNFLNGGAAAQEGDPHLKTVNGVHYDLQGAGEFVSLRDGRNMEIQTRQTPVATTFFPTDQYDGLSTCVSLNTAVAARVGKHRITYEPNLNGVPDPNGLQLRMDGAIIALSPNGLDLGDGGRLKKTGAPGGLEIDFPDETVLLVTPGWWGPPQNKWYLNVDVSNTSAVEGLLGLVPKGSWLPVLPDGTSMGPMPGSLHQRYVDLYQKFAESWRVTDKTSLFDYAAGTSTASFITRTWPPEKPPCMVGRTTPAQPASRMVAQSACSTIKDENTRRNCEFDVMVAGHTGFATTYQIHEQVRVRSKLPDVRPFQRPNQPERRQ